MGVTLLISFENEGESECFYPGQIIQGKVTLDNDAEVKVKGLTITFFGDVEVYWTEAQALLDTVSPHRNQSSNYSQTRRHVHKEFRNHETILCHEIVLFGQGEAEGGTEFIMAAGKKEYRFQYQLPAAGIPSTFTDLPYGSIRYTAEARLKRPLFRYDKVEKEFAVKEILEISCIPRVLQPISIDERLEIGWICCPEGYMTIDLRLPKTGYTPGETISFTVSIINLSRTVVNQIFATLTQDIQFSTFNQKKTVSTDLQHVSLQSVVQPYGTTRWNESFTISRFLRPSTLAGCSMISLHYSIKVTVKAANESCMVACPIFLGTEPFDVERLNNSILANSAGAYSPCTEIETEVPVAFKPYQEKMQKEYNPALNPFLNSESDDGLNTINKNGKDVADTTLSFSDNFLDGL